MVVKKIWQLRNFTLIVLLRKEVPNLLRRSSLWLIIIPAWDSEMPEFLLGRSSMKIFCISHTICKRVNFYRKPWWTRGKTALQIFQQTQESPSFGHDLIFLRWEKFMSGTDYELREQRLACPVNTRYTVINKNKTPSSHHGVCDGHLQ